MLTSAVSTLAPAGARLRNSQPAVTRVLGATASAAALRLCHQQQQTRAFRFGWWADGAGRDEPHASHHRQRSLRHHYLLALKHKDLLWAQRACGSESPRAAKRSVNHYWQSKRSFAFGGGCNSRSIPDRQSGTRPGQNIEDVENTAWSHFLFQDKTGVDDAATKLRGSWSSPLEEIREYISRRRPHEFFKEVNASSAGSGSTKSSADEGGVSRGKRENGAEDVTEYVIDPITNRKVAKPASRTSASAPGSAKTFKSYRSQFPAPDWLQKQDDAESPVSFDDPLAATHSARKIGSKPSFDTDLPPTSDELRAYQEIVVDDIPLHDSAAAGKSRADCGLSDTRAPVFQSEEYVRQHQPDPSAISDSSEASYMSWKYKGMFWRQGAGSGLLDSAAPASAMGSIPATKASESSECDKHADAVTEPPAASLPKYEDLDKYTAVEYCEPDGKSADEAKPADTYSDTHLYGPVKHNEPDGKPADYYLKTDQVDPSELAKYKPFKWNEPDGQPTTPPVELGHEGYDPEEVQKYQPFKYNEPDGKPPAEQVSKADNAASDQAELDKYKPFNWNEPDGQPTTEPVELGHEGYDPKEVQKYQAFRYNEPDGQPTTGPVELGHEGYDPTEVQKYQAFRYNEPDGQPTTGAVELGHEGYDPTEVQKYQAFRYNEPDGQPTTEPVELGHEGYDPKEVQKYQAFRYNEPDGQPATGVEESGSETDASLGHYQKQFAGKSPDGQQCEASELGRYGAFRYNEPDGKAEEVSNSVAEGLKSFDGQLAGNTSSGDVYSKVLRKHSKLTAAEGGAAGSPDPSVLESSMERISAESDRIDRLASAFVKSSKSRSGRGRRLSEAQRMQAQVDPYSTEPQGLETSYADECRGEPTWPTYVKIHKAATKAEAETQDAPSEAPASEPAVYKILAYDPTMQTINVAETTSTVPDTASPLTPAEALLRLSNPTKFFPHFKALQAQGFEIVSGSGDVLVFRKVREYPAKGVEAEAAGMPALAASEVAASSVATAPSKSRSNTSIRREEDVFSGPKPKRENAKSETTNMAKRVVVGATWVAGISYGLGVVGEYAKGSTSSASKKP